MKSISRHASKATLLKAELDKLLKSSVFETGLPFSQAIVINKEGAVYQGSFGDRAWGNGEAVDETTVILLASATKPVTAVAALQLYEQGLLDLDAPASTYLPEIKELVVLEGWRDDGSPVTRPPETEITVRHLLTHTSGLSYEIWNEDVVRYMAYREIPGLATLKRQCLFTPLVAEPGTQWEYGISIDWIGQIIEVISGLSLESYFREHIFIPLGMQSTSFKLSGKMRERLGKVHLRRDDGKTEPTDFIAEQAGEFEEAGGGLYSTCEDYSKFLRMILNQGMGENGQVLCPETVKLLTDNAIGDLRVKPMRTVSPEESNDVEFFPGVEKTWSLGFMRNESKTPTGRCAGSVAWAGLFNVYFWIDPTTEIAGVFATQLLPFADPKALAAFSRFEATTYRLIAV